MDWHWPYEKKIVSRCNYSCVNDIERVPISALPLTLSFSSLRGNQIRGKSLCKNNLCGKAHILVTTPSRTWDKDTSHVLDKITRWRFSQILIQFQINLWHLCVFPTEWIFMILNSRPILKYWITASGGNWQNELWVENKMNWYRNRSSCMHQNSR